MLTYLTISFDVVAPFMQLLIIIEHSVMIIDHEETTNVLMKTFLFF